MPLATENTEGIQTARALAGTAGNPAREPARKRPKDGPGSLGDEAFNDAVLLVGLCWLLLVVLAYSVRHHNF